MWAVKHRPRLLSDVLGQSGTIKILKARLRDGKAGDTSYILSGGFGNGKTTIARILACGILCENIDPKNPEPCYECASCKDFVAGSSQAYNEFDAASNGTIAKVRANIVDVLAYSVLGSAAKRIFVIDECHQLSKDAQDAILKPLEEKQMVCIFCTTELNKVRGAIRSRCEEHFIRKVTREEICENVKRILDIEGVLYQEDAVLTVIDYCDCHIRDVLNRLETIAQIGSISLENVRDSLHIGVVPLYYETLLSLDNPPKAIEIVERILETIAPEDALHGLAEAAMNAFRLAYGVSANFVSVDRSLAKSVFNRYGLSVVELAGFFSKSRHTSHTGVICDVLTALQQKSPVQEPKPATCPAPVQQELQTPLPQTQLSQTATAKLPPQAVPAQATTTSIAVVSPQHDVSRHLTEVDHNVVGGPFPRGHSSPGVKPIVERSTSTDWLMGPIPSCEWRKMFEGHYYRLRPNVGMGNT